MDPFWLGVIVGATSIIGLLATILGIAWWADGPLNAHMNRNN